MSISWVDSPFPMVMVSPSRVMGWLDKSGAGGSGSGSVRSSAAMVSTSCITCWMNGSLSSFSGVRHLTVHNAALGQGLPDGDGVDVVKAVLFCLSVEAVLLDKLGNPALHLGPGQAPVPSGLSGRTENGALPSPPSNSRASHAAVSFSLAWASPCSGQRRACSRCCRSMSWIASSMSSCPREGAAARGAVG